MSLRIRSLRKRTRHAGLRRPVLESLESRLAMAAAVAVEIPGPSAVEESDSQGLVYRFTRDDATSPLAVAFEIDAQATYGEDFSIPGVNRHPVFLRTIDDQVVTSPKLVGSVQFLPGEASVELTLKPVDDARIEPDEPITVRLLEPAAFGPVTGAANNHDAQADQTTYYVVDAFNRLGVIDTTTGIVDLVGTIPVQGTITDIAINEFGQVYVITFDSLYYLGQVDGLAAPLGALNLGPHGVTDANSLVDARNGDFGSQAGDLFIAGTNQLWIQRIDLVEFNQLPVKENVVPVFAVDQALFNRAFPHQYVASGDLDYDRSDDLILTARHVDESFDSIIEIEASAEFGIIDKLPVSAQDIREDFVGISGVASYGSQGFGFAGYLQLSVNQITLNSNRSLEIVGRDYELSEGASEATGEILGQPIDPPIVTPNAALPDAFDLSRGPQPTSWQQQASTLQGISIQLGAPIDEIPLDQIALTNLGVNASATPESVTLDASQLTLSASGDRIEISFQPGDLADGRYQLDLGPDVTNGPPLELRGDVGNQLFVLRGDFDGNGHVDARDSDTLAYWYAQTIFQAPSYVDLDGSRRIDEGDLEVLRQQIGASVVLPALSDPQPEFNTPQAIDSAISTILDPLDVNGNGRVTPLDALMVIGRFVRQIEGPLDWRFDVNRNGSVTVSDAIFVINYLSSIYASPGGESIEIDPEDGSGPQANALSGNASLQPMGPHLIDDGQAETRRSWEQNVDLLAASRVLG